MNHESSFHPPPHYPPIVPSEFLGTQEAPHGELDYGACPLMSTVNAVSRIPSSIPSLPTGPFVTMHISHYFGLLRQLEALSQPSQVTVASSGPGIVPVSGTMSSAVVSAVVAPQEAQASVHALMSAGSEGGGSQLEMSTGKRSKVACNSCSDAHKTCDQGRPCGRCTKRGIDASCVYPPSKGGRRTRKVALNESDGQRAGLSSANYLPQLTGVMQFTNPTASIPPIPDIFQGNMFEPYANNGF
ncbi:hypothetical protein LXA43DRAFT_1035503 [Ganoderma leucocontextum]|nr:hypothetical protein LXA43DRAFT_1035503 [Ganoderma leucocontextum]